MRRSARALILVTAVGTASTGVSACKRPGSEAALPDASRTSTDEVIAAVVPGVVLLISRHPNGAIGFGAGVIIGDDGVVLTNLHVVANGSLGALLHDPKRISYIPQDGGLARYLFENDAQIIATRLVRADPVLDLALVKIATETKEGSSRSATSYRGKGNP